MRNLEAIEKDLAAARETLSTVKGTPAEVYSRIVGYYRSVRNWNLGKREEYGERRLYRINNDELAAAASSQHFSLENDYSPKKDFHSGQSESMETGPSHFSRLQTAEQPVTVSQTLLLLFIRASCPGCSPARDAAERLGIQVNLMNADTDEGKAEAIRRKVLSTPTAILLSPGGEELARAVNAEAIDRLLNVQTVTV